MEKFILLADDKGFSSSFFCNKPYKYSPQREKLRRLFIMTEIQEWLRNEHNVYTNCERYYEDCYISVVKYKESNEMFLSDHNLWTEEFCDSSPKKFLIFEEALEEAILKGLEMIGGKTV